jgi:hypothetical protein
MTIVKKKPFWVQPENLTQFLIGSPVKNPVTTIKVKTRLYKTTLKTENGEFTAFASSRKLSQLFALEKVWISQGRTPLSV